MHILSASLGKPHPLASAPVIEDPLGLEEFPVDPVVSIMINNSMICASQVDDYSELLTVAVIEWKTGKYFVSTGPLLAFLPHKPIHPLQFHEEIRGAAGAVLLSSPHLS
jgi:hypothetical protein